MLPISTKDSQVLTKKTSEDARQYVYRVLHRYIMAIVLPPDHKVSELDVAQSLHVSRTPVHDTLIRLARERLVRIIPKRGAYVMPIDQDAFHQSIWMHLQMGTATLNSIFIKKKDTLDLDILNYILHQINESAEANDYSQISRFMLEYYHRLYLISGDMELVWESLIGASTDFQRILALATKNPVAVTHFLDDLSRLTDALIARDNDLACDIYRNHLNHLYQVLPVLKKQYPAYFKPMREASHEQYQ